MANDPVKCTVYAENDGNPKANDLIGLKLSPELLEALKNGELEFKAADTESFICSKSKTYKLSGSSCNPTMCLMGSDKKDAEAFCLGTAVKTSLVADEVPGSIDWETIPVYSSSGLNRTESLDTIMKRSFCSRLEFEQLWKDRGGLSVGGNGCALTDDLVYKIGTELNSTIFSQESDDFDTIYSHTTKIYPVELYRAVYTRFWPGTKLAEWFGRRLLVDMDSKETQVFMSRWKRDLLGMDVSLDLLAGHCIEVGPKILYVDRENLPTSPKKRLEYLFDIKNDWNVTDLAPFYSDLCDVSDKRGTEAFLKSFSKVINTQDPKIRGKIVKKVQMLR